MMSVAMVSVAIIVGLFFVIGIVVGIITVIALSVLRRGRRGRRGDPDSWTGYRPEVPDEPPPDPGWDTVPPGRPPWWQARDDE